MTRSGIRLFDIALSADKVSGTNKLQAPKKCSTRITPEPNRTDMKITGIQDSRIGKRNEWFKTLVLRNYDCPLGQYFGLPPCGHATLVARRRYCA